MNIKRYLVKHSINDAVIRDMEKLKRFFWLCSGANKKHLDECPNDASKYAGIGATVFFTSVFASLAAAYALFTVFDNYWIAGLFGLLWGLMIFNLDRYIVSSMRKHKNGWRNLLNIVPRLLLAVVISIVIAKPLELKIFEKETLAEIAIMQEEQRQQNEALISSRFIVQKEQLQAEIKILKQEINDKTDKRDELRKIASQEADGTGGTGKRNPGPIYKIKKAAADQMDAELNELRETNQAIINTKMDQLAAIGLAFENAKNELTDADLTGLASRIAALERISVKNNAIWMANLFIMFLFVLVECSPIIVKLMSGKSSYDHVLELEEYKYESQSYKRRAKANQVLRRQAHTLEKEEEEFMITKLDAGLDKV